MRVLISLVVPALFAGGVMVYLKVSGEVDMPWELATFPWWGYVAFLGIIYALSCVLVAYNLIKGN